MKRPFSPPFFRLLMGGLFGALLSGCSSSNPYGTGAGNGVGGAATKGATVASGTHGATTSGATGSDGAASTAAATGSGGTSAGAAAGTTAGPAAAATTTQGSGSGPGGSGAGSSTGGASSGGCGGCEFGACSSDADCAIGEVCVIDLQISSSESICEYSCTIDADCPNAATLCSNSAAPLDKMGEKTCAGNFCAAGSVPGSPCDATAVGAQDGTCVPQDDTGEVDVVICMPNGTASACAPEAGNDDPLTDEGLESPQPRTPALLCPAGQACNSEVDTDAGFGNTGATCGQLCLPGDGFDAGCPVATVCINPDFTDTTWGFCGLCIEADFSCNFDSQCCGSRPGACGQGFCTDCNQGQPEFGSCDTDTDCSCNLNCVTDSLLSDVLTSMVCEQTCTTTADCRNAATTCINGLCAVNTCGAGGSVGSPCNANGQTADSGTCIPQDQSGTRDVLLCVLDGTASTCSGAANNDDPFYYASVNSVAPVATPQFRNPSKLCPAGEGCQSNDFGAGSCAQLCVPGGAGCPASTTCIAQDPKDFSWGYCGPCVVSGGTCALNSDCCSATCNSTTCH